MNFSFSRFRNNFFHDLVGAFSVLLVFSVVQAEPSQAQLGSQYDPQTGQDSGLFQTLEDTTEEVSLLDLATIKGYIRQAESCYFFQASGTPENFQGLAAIFDFQEFEEAQALAWFEANQEHLLAGDFEYNEDGLLVTFRTSESFMRLFCF